MIHDLDEIIGKEFHAVATHANGTAVKDMEGFGKLTEKIALSTILVALLNADPDVNASAPSTTHQAQKAFPSLKQFVQGLRDEIKDITDNDLGLTILNNHFEKPEIKAQLSPEWLSPDYRKAFESLNWMSIADDQHYRIEDFPKQLVWMKN